MLNTLENGVEDGRQDWGETNRHRDFNVPEDPTKLQLEMHSLITTAPASSFMQLLIPSSQRDNFSQIFIHMLTTDLHKLGVK